MGWLERLIGKLLARPGSRLRHLDDRISQAHQAAWTVRQEVHVLRAEVHGLREQLHAMDERLAELLHAMRRADPANLDGRHTVEHDELSRQYLGWRSGDLVRAVKKLRSQARGVDRAEQLRWRAMVMRDLCLVLLTPADAPGDDDDERLYGCVDALLGHPDWREDGETFGDLRRARDGAGEFGTAAGALGDHAWDWSYTEGELVDQDRHEVAPGSTGDRIEFVVAPAYAIRGGWAVPQLVFAS